MKHWKILVGIILTILIIAVVVVRAYEIHAVYQYTDTGRWEVEQGDTLWDIAQFYSDNRHDNRRVIHDIYALNEGLTAELEVGAYVNVPLYDCMDWEYYDGSCDVPYQIEADRIEECRWLVLTVYDSYTGAYVQSYDIDLWAVAEFEETIKNIKEEVK